MVDAGSICSTAAGPKMPEESEAWASLSTANIRRPVRASAPAAWWMTVVFEHPPLRAVALMIGMPDSLPWTIGTG